MALHFELKTVLCLPSYATLIDQWMIHKPHDCLVIDTHPETSIDKRLRRNFDNVLIMN